MNAKKILLVLSIVASYGIVVGCGNSAMPASANKSLSDHIDTSITPQQRIDKIQANPSLSADQKQRFIAAIKARNHM